jgi:hypothetical protein
MPFSRPFYALPRGEKVGACNSSPLVPQAKSYNQGESNSYRIHGKDA